jgi:tRNA-dihydrouridine synthase B
LEDHYALYGEGVGVRSARKHIGWTLRHLRGGEAFRQIVNTIEDSRTQWHTVAQWFADLARHHQRVDLVMP